MKKSIETELSRIPDPSLREQLMLRAFTPYAERLAARERAGLPPSIDQHDAVSFALVGLWEAAKAWDPSRGVRFKTYAHFRIIGAIRDGSYTATGLRRAAVRSGYSATFVSIDEVEPPRSDESRACPGQEVDHREMRKDVQQAVALLPEDLRVVVEMVDLDDMSYSECGQVLGIHKTSVLRRRLRAHRILEERLMRWETAA